MSLLDRLDVPEAKSRGSDETHGQAAGHGVEGAARPDHSATDDENVDLGAGESGQGGVPGAGRERGHVSPRPPSRASVARLSSSDRIPPHAARPTTAAASAGI